MDGVVLRIDGQQGHVAVARQPGEDFSGGNHGLLVGQANGLPRRHGGVGSFEASQADDRRDHEIHLG